MGALRSISTGAGRRWRGGVARIGIALGRDAVHAVARCGADEQRVRVALDANAEDRAGALGAALGSAARELSAACGATLEGARVHVALLPPHCDVRLVALPPLRPSEAEAVIRRDAARHFMGGNGPRVVAVMQPAMHRAATGAAPPVLAAAASIALLETVRTAIQACGWRVESIVAAHAAWIAAARDARDARAREPGVLLVADGDAVHVFRIERDVTELRRVPAAWTSDVASAVGPGPGHATLIAGAARMHTVAPALEAAGWTVERIPHDDPAVVAAMWADRAGLRLTPPTLRAERRRRDRARAKLMFAATIVLLGAAALLELWGARRELDAVRARRAEIRSEVMPLLATRDSIARLDGWTTAIDGIESVAPHWTRALFDLAMLLPKDAYVTILQTRGDTLRGEVVGTRAGEALQALRPAQSLTDVRLDGFVQRDLEEGTTSVERFRFTARLTNGHEDEDGVDGSVQAAATRRRP